jgi:hypothetical protein
MRSPSLMCASVHQHRSRGASGRRTSRPQPPGILPGGKNPRASHDPRAPLHQAGTTDAQNVGVTDKTGTTDRSSEEKMRSAFEARRGTPFSDEEWEEAKRNLVSLFLTLGADDVAGSDDERSD